MDAAATSISARRMGGFLRAHLGYVLLAPALIFAGTVVHEYAHALAGIALGGHVIYVDVLPSWDEYGFRFGQTLLDRHFGDRQWLVTMAPALAWTAIAASALLWVGRVRRPRVARVLFLFLFVLPLADISMQLSGLYCNASASDYYKVLADWKLATAVVAAAYFVSFGYAGWKRLCRPIFRDNALSTGEYALGLTALLAAP